MRVRKTVTEEVVQANQNNAKKTPGPEDTSRTKYNAKTHGFLANKIVFADEAQEKEHACLLADLVKHCRPEGPEEQTEVEIMAISKFHLRGLYAWEFAETSKLINPPTSTIQPTPTGGEVTPNATLQQAAERGLQVQAVMWRTVPRRREKNEDPLNELCENPNNIILGAKLANRLDLVDRYRTRHLRIYHGALAALRDLQRDRAELKRLRSSRRADEGEVDE